MGVREWRERVLVEACFPLCPQPQCSVSSCFHPGFLPTSFHLSSYIQFCFPLSTPQRWLMCMLSLSETFKHWATLWVKPEWYKPATPLTALFKNTEKQEYCYALINSLTAASLLRCCHRSLQSPALCTEASSQGCGPKHLQYIIPLTGGDAFAGTV